MNKLGTGLDEAYSAYQQDPSKKNLNQVVRGLQPTINHQLASLGVSNDPVMKSRALVYTAQAIPNYDPSKSGLPTFISSQLQRLTRDKRERSTPLKIPERAQLDAWNLHVQEKEFTAKHGREPDLGELSDYTGLSHANIRKIRDTMVATPHEDAFDGNLEHESPDFTEEAIGYVYADSDHLDRKIMEMKMGYMKSKGYQPLKANQIASKLGVSPSQVSRRAMRLSLKINEITDALNT